VPVYGKKSFLSMPKIFADLGKKFRDARESLYSTSDCHRVEGADFGKLGDSKNRSIPKEAPLGPNPVPSAHMLWQSTRQPRGC